MHGSVELAFVGRDEPKNGCEGGYATQCTEFEIDPSILSSYFFTTNLKVKLSRPNGIACLRKRKLPRRRAYEHCNH